LIGITVGSTLRRVNQLVLRPVLEPDLAVLERVSEETFLEADRLTRRALEPEPEPRSSLASIAWMDRMRYLISTDPSGCWVAEDDGQPIGFAFSQNRGPLWYLATYGVLPSHQGAGVGRALLDVVLEHAADRPGLFSSTVHPGATRRYRLAGFSLHPQLRMVGVVDRSTLRATTGLHEGDAGDIAWMDKLDERLRGAGHGPDHEYLLERARLVVRRGTTDQGYVYVDRDGRGPRLLAARERSTAETLLWEALAATPGSVLVNCITTANEWAVDVGLAARLDIGQEGYLAVRGMGLPAPYLPSSHFL
jgi:GNAT superfamily N-acetyltransferase